MDYIDDKTRQSKHSRTWTKRRDRFKHKDMAPAATIIRFSNIPGYTNAAGVSISLV